VLVSVLGSLFAIQMMLPRLYYAMSRDGLFPSSLGRLHPTRGTPVRAIALQAVLGSVLVALGSFDAIVAYFIFVTVAFIGLTVVGLFKLRRTTTMARRHDGTMPEQTKTVAPAYLTPGFPATALIFLGLVFVLLLMLVISRPVQALAGTAIVLLGLPVYAVIGRRSVASRPVPEA
jgi:APA family basic amino acid/polyamine antiporter